MPASQEPRTVTRMGAGREFDVIRSFQDAVPGTAPGVVVGPGDDAAVLDGGWVVTTDLTVEDVHFRNEWISPDDVGYRAVAVALSDLAAMAADAVGVLVSIAVAEGDLDGVVPGIRAGMAAACADAGCALLGGDLSRSPGPLMLDVVGLGRTYRAVLRSGARAGDGLWVTGELGASAAAVHSWKSGRDPGPELLRRFARPRPLLSEAAWLAGRGALTALIDVSDGLVADVGHIAAASAVGIELRPDEVPVARLASDAAESRSEALEWALSGGEDYELCFTAPQGNIDPLRQAFEAEFGLVLTRIGTVGEGAGVRLTGPGTDPRAGYDHFAPPGDHRDPL